jgi:enoyl-CoA hydratase
LATVRTTVVERVATVVLDDAERRNALSPALVDELVATFDTIEASGEVGAVVVTGAPPSFCAGADLSHLGASREEGLRGIYEGFLRVSRSTLPTIAAVNGPAVGAGMNLALACDVRLAGRAARFDTRFLQLGIHPGGGHTWMLHRIAGPQTAAALVLFGEVVDGTEAERVGLVWRCVDDDELLVDAQRLAARAASAPGELVTRTKQTLSSVPGIDDHDRAVEVELRTQLWSMDQPEFATRLEAMRRRINRG